jgi:hypothetical protein
VGQLDEQLFAWKQRLLDEWEQLYREVFHCEVDLSTIKIPKRRLGFDRLIVVAQGITLKQIVQASQKYYAVQGRNPSRLFTDLEETRGTHDRVPTVMYAVWVRDQVDPDAEHIYGTVRWTKFRNVQGITLLEHLLFNLKYFKETGLLLDRNVTSTICSGSRYGQFFVPVVFSGRARAGKSLYIGGGGLYFTERFGAREVIA